MPTDISPTDISPTDTTSVIMLSIIWLAGYIFVWWLSNTLKFDESTSGIANEVKKK